MGCINDHPVYLYTLAACSNFLPYLLVNLEPRNGLVSVFIAVNIGIIGSGFITANVPGVNMNNIASSLPLLFALSFVMWSAIQLFSTVAILFALLGVFGSAVVVNKEEVHDMFKSVLNVDIGDTGFYLLVGAVILVLFFAYYSVTSSYLLSIVVQTIIYSIEVTVSIHWLWEAVNSNFVVCCNSDNLDTCPIYFAGSWWMVLIGLMLLRCVMIFWYVEYERTQMYKQYKKLESPKIRHGGDGTHRIRLIY